MVFNSGVFLVFFILVYSLYLVLNHRWQNWLLLVASYVFYGWWDWRFLGLLFISTVIDFFCGRAIQNEERESHRRFYLTISMCANLIILGFFKYFNFFAESLQSLGAFFGWNLHPTTLHIILPVGISFYTFQSMSYAIDVYRRHLKAAEHFWDFALFVSFFPQLVAGPIERAVDLLPQILKPRKVRLEQCYEGCYLIFWGLFKKIFIADNLAKIVDQTFNAPGPYMGSQVLLAVYAFAFQIYCDFSGYSDMARGLAKLMGFELMVNFNLPYFATNPSDFWRRWHISLSTWLRDYLYIPLGGNQKGTGKTYRNLFLTMFLGGLWHGAAWTFIVWGTYQGVLLIVHRLMQPVFKSFPKITNTFLSNVWLWFRIVFFFHLVCIGWLFFRASSLPQAFDMIKAIFTDFNLSQGVGLRYMTIYLVFYAGLLILVQIYQYLKNDLMAIYKTHFLTRAAFYYVVFYLVIIFGQFGEKQFIYFQF